MPDIQKGRTFLRIFAPNPETVSVDPAPSQATVQTYGSQCSSRSLIFTPTISLNFDSTRHVSMYLPFSETTLASSFYLSLGNTKCSRRRKVVQEFQSFVMHYLLTPKYQGYPHYYQHLLD